MCSNCTFNNQYIKHMNIEKILNVDENMCLQSYPCKHHVQVQLVNGTIQNMLMSGPQIYELCVKHNYQLTN